jgi:hypothetical protein
MLGLIESVRYGNATIEGLAEACDRGAFLFLTMLLIKLYARKERTFGIWQK